MNDQKIQEYQEKLNKYQTEYQNIERQMIILEEQLKQQESKLQEAFQTTDPNELTKIMTAYDQEIKDLEVKIEGLE